ncbi:MAG: hypothetical protein ABIK65_11400 [Candidatus Eisenbacteria bacterium]
MNSEVKKLHKQLIEAHQGLAKRLGKTKDQEEAEDVLREMEELSFRVMMAGRLLFKETTANVDKRIGTVLDAGADLDQAIKDIEKVKDLVKAVGKFLAVVDKVFDAIKIL